MTDILKEKWDPIKDVDPAKRRPTEWAKIYLVELVGDIPNSLWNEYEWAYNFSKLDYRLLPDRNKDGSLLGTYEKAEDMEMRAMELKRDLFMGADIGEKYVLQEKYIETEWVRRKLSLSI